MAFATGPEWSTKQWAWPGSNPGHLDGFKSEWMKQRLEQIKFLEVTTAMLPYGVPFPVMPESTTIMNIIVPEMLQNALTEKMTVKAGGGRCRRPDQEAARRAQGLTRVGACVVLGVLTWITLDSRASAPIHLS